MTNNYLNLLFLKILILPKNVYFKLKYKSILNKVNVQKYKYYIKLTKCLIIFSKN